MSIRELRSLVAIADHGSITSAADAIYLSVPAVSAHIANLESEFSARLLDRRRKPARLTDTGRTLAERSRQILKQYERLSEGIGQPEEVAGSITVGASVTVLAGVISKALVQLRQNHPRLQIRVVYGRPWVLLEQLAQNELDAAIIGEPRGHTADISWTPCASEAIVVIAPPCATGSDDASLLAEFPYIRYSRSLWVSRLIEEHLSQRHIHLRDAMEVDSREAIEVMVRHGLGVSIIPQSDSGIAGFYDLKTVPLGSPPLKWPIGLAQRDDCDKLQLVAALFRTLKACAEDEAVPVA